MTPGGSRSLVLWSAVVLALIAAHDVTHVVDDGLETPLGQLAYVAGPQWLFLVVAMLVILRADPARSRIAALLVGISVAVAFAGIHLLPFSPAGYWDLSPSAVSWALVWLPSLASLVLVMLAWPRRGVAAPARAAS